MLLVAAAAGDVAPIFLELGAIVVALAILARIATWANLSPIPLYLLAGLAFGAANEVVGLSLSEEFVEIGAQIGVILLLFMLGLEYTGEELRDNLRSGGHPGLVDLALNFPPGLLAGLLLGWGPVVSLLLGGVTYISSSGVISKLLADLDRLGNRETPAVLTLLVIEDLVMAAYLPLIAVLLLGTGVMAGILSLAVAIVAAGLVLFVATRHGPLVSRLLANRSDEVLLLSVLGLIFVVAGLAEQLQVSAAVGAFLVGIAVSEPVADRARLLLEPLRDLFAATFFLFFGLQIDAATIPPVLGVAALLALVSAATKLATGWIVAGRAGAAVRGRLRAGGTLIARGEFSIVIAGLGVAAGVEPRLGSLAAAYVLLLAVGGPLVARYADAAAGLVGERRAQP